MTLPILATYKQPEALAQRLYTLMRGTWITTGGVVVYDQFGGREIPVASDFNPTKVLAAKADLVREYEAQGYSCRNLSPNCWQLHRCEGQTPEPELEDVYIYVRLRLITA